MLFCVGVSELAPLNFVIAVGVVIHTEKAQTYSCIRNVCRYHKSDFSSLCVDLGLMQVVNLGARFVSTDNFAHEGRVTYRHTNKAGQKVLFRYVTHLTV